MGNQQGQQSRLHSSELTSDTEPFGRERILLKQAFQELTDDNGRLSKSIFQEKLFPAHQDYGQLLYEHFIRGVKDGESSGLTESQYVEGGLLIYQNGSVPHVETYFQVFSGNEQTIKRNDASTMFYACLQLSWSCSHPEVNPQKDDPILVAMVQSLFGSSEEVRLSNFVSWYSRNCGQLFSGVHQVTTQKLMGWSGVRHDESDGASAGPSASEVIQHIKEGKSPLNAASLWALSTSLPPIYLPSVMSDPLNNDLSFDNPVMKIISPSGWHMLYNSSSHGLSMRSFQHRVLEYKGPTVTLILFKDHLYCLAADSEWREGFTKFGSTDCCLYQMYPKYTLMLSGADMLYLNLTGTSSPRGLHIGKDPPTTFLTIDEDFDKVIHYGLPYELYNLEVWGCGGLNAKAAQEKQKQWEKKQVQKSKDRKMKMDDWMDSPDRQLLELGGVKTEHSER